MNYSVVSKAILLWLYFTNALGILALLITMCIQKNSISKSSYCSVWAEKYYRNCMNCYVFMCIIDTLQLLNYFLDKLSGYHPLKLYLYSSNIIVCGTLVSHSCQSCPLLLYLQCLHFHHRIYLCTELQTKTKV